MFFDFSDIVMYIHINSQKKNKQSRNVGVHNHVINATNLILSISHIQDAPSPVFTVYYIAL